MECTQPQAPTPCMARPPPCAWSPMAQCMAPRMGRCMARRMALPRTWSHMTTCRMLCGTAAHPRSPQPSARRTAATASATASTAGATAALLRRLLGLGGGVRGAVGQVMVGITPPCRRRAPRARRLFLVGGTLICGGGGRGAVSKMLDIGLSMLMYFILCHVAMLGRRHGRRLHCAVLFCPVAGFSGCAGLPLCLKCCNATTPP